MTFLFTASIPAVTGEVAIFNWKQLLISAGWVCVSSSNATLFGSTDYISTSAALANSNAWFVMKQPLGATASYGGVRRELAVQRGAASTGLKIFYSYSSSFTGSAGLTAMPSASDGVRVVGDQAMAAAGFDTTFLPADNGYKLSAMADDASPFGTWFACIPNAGGQPTAGFVMDPIQAGTSASADVDPYVFYPASRGAGTTNLFKGTLAAATMTATSTGAISTTPLGYTRKSMFPNGNNWVGFAACAWAVNNASQYFLGFGVAGAANPHDASDDTAPILYARAATGGSFGGYKGVSSLMRWKSANRATGDTISTTTGSKDGLVLQDVVVPWNGADYTF